MFVAEQDERGGEDDVQVARVFRVTKMSANRWRREMAVGDTDALASKGAAGMRCLLTGALGQARVAESEQVRGLVRDEAWRSTLESD